MVGTCRAIVGMAVGLGVEPEDRSRTWKADAEEALKRGRRAQATPLCRFHFVTTLCLFAKLEHILCRSGLAATSK